MPFGIKLPKIRLRKAAEAITDDVIERVARAAERASGSPAQRARIVQILNGVVDVPFASEEVEAAVLARMAETVAKALPDLVRSLDPYV